GRHRRDDCDAHDCREKSLHQSFHSLSASFGIVPCFASGLCAIPRHPPLALTSVLVGYNSRGDKEQPRCQIRPFRQGRMKQATYSELSKASDGVVPCTASTTGAAFCPSARLW